MINRTIQPPIQKIEEVSFVSPINHPISENVSLFHMNKVSNETTRFDLYFDAGKIRTSGGIAGFVNGLILSGTKDKTSIEINEAINGLGGFYDSGVSAENAVISMYALKENMIPLFDILMDAISNVIFDEKEVDEFINDSRQRQKINSEKVSYLAQKNFQKILFENEKAYATTLEVEDYDKLEKEDLVSFHANHYLNGLRKVVVVGDIDQPSIAHIIDKCRPIISKKEHSFSDKIQNKAEELRVPKKDAIQSAIRIGRTLFNKNHPDYLDFLILNTILGDYFGSRLMSNIREDKGYTYGIGSMLSELEKTGYFMIATEVGHEVKDLTIKEIKFEINRLQTELVKDDELALVQNYMLGQLLKSADGPYAMMDLFLSVEMYDKELEFYNLAIAAIQNITAKRIQDLAKQYLNWNEMSVVIAG